MPDQNSSPQKTENTQSDGREYLKKLNSQIDFSRAGQCFVTSLPKPSSKTTAPSQSSDTPKNEENKKD